MSGPDEGGPSFAQYPRCQVAYTEAVPIQSVAPIPEPENQKKTHYSSKIPKGPNKTTKNKPSVNKKSKKRTTLKPNVKRKDFDVVYEESKYDFSKLPPPVCSCTGVARQCYKCGINGWQSSCCTSRISVFPLPTRPLRPGVRVGGRKMTLGAYRKLLCKLASEGYDLSHPVDLKAHWAKHGTNNFVTFK